jgi:hypothetical protein
MDILAQYWIEVDKALEDVECRVEEFRYDTMLEIRIQGLNRDWKEIAKRYKTYNAAVCVVWMARTITHSFSVGHLPG